MFQFNKSTVVIGILAVIIFLSSGMERGFTGSDSPKGEEIQVPSLTLDCTGCIHPDPSWWAESDQAGALFGWRVSFAGDVNGDGYDDVIVGAPLYDDPLLDAGRAYVYHGGPAGFEDTPSWTKSGGQQTARLGLSIAGAGDVNSDGYDEHRADREKQRPRPRLPREQQRSRRHLLLGSLRRPG